MACPGEDGPDGGGGFAPAGLRAGSAERMSVEFTEFSAHRRARIRIGANQPPARILHVTLLSITEPVFDCLDQAWEIKSKCPD